MQQWCTGIWLVLVAIPVFARDLPLDLIKLPAGFKISLYTADVPNARAMNMSPTGTLFVGSRHAGKVYAIRDSNGDGRGDRVYVLAEGLNMPNGVAFHGGALYVAEVNRILRFDNIEHRLVNPPKPVVVSTDFPAEQHHGWKFIRIGPDNKLYVPIGAPCNVCIEYGYAVITRLALDGSQHESYAEGVRNTVGFDWHPDTRELWFTDNGRDQLGDDLPADELNRAADEGMHFGFPYCHAGDVLDPDFGLGHGCHEYVPPVQKLGAHVAALGMRFYTGNMFPSLYRKQIFIAEHGSWNRSRKSGYRISLVRLKANKAVSYEPFAEGWLQGQKAWGRPVDIEHMADGSLLVSDDKAGAIYRISYTGEQPSTMPAMQTHETQGGGLPDRQPQQDEMYRTQQMLPLSVEESATDNKPVTKPVTQQATPQTPRRSDDASSTGDQNQTLQSGGKENITVESDVQAEAQPHSTQQAVPPPELIEQIRARTDKSDSQTVDPFSSVNKQTIHQ